MIITLGIQIWEVPLPNQRTGNVDGVLWFPEGTELYSEYQMELECEIGEHLIIWRIRPDVKEGKGTPVVLSGRILRGLVPNLAVLKLFEREVRGGVVVQLPQAATTAPKRYLVIDGGKKP